MEPSQSEKIFAMVTFCFYYYIKLLQEQLQEPEYLGHHIFSVLVKPGYTKIVRSSKDSSVTIPFKQTYRDLTQVTEVKQEETRFCGCGWPHNLLIPKGKLEGYPCELFVMISDYDDDKVRDKVLKISILGYFDTCRIFAANVRIVLDEIR